VTTTLTHALDRRSIEVRRARREVHDACAGLGAELTASAQVMTSELVTNALDHGRGLIVLTITRTPSRLHVAVTDEGREIPRRVTPHGTRGRGLVLVEELSSDWGVDALPTGGKSVWFNLGWPG
jgi:two-component sensor histidine kinase